MFLLELLKHSAKGAESLNDRAVEKLRCFLLSLERGDGGFAGMVSVASGDVYYTPFAVMALSALGDRREFRGIANFAESKRCLGSLDLAHLASLCRIHALSAVSGQLSGEKTVRKELIREIEKFRSADGGFSHFARFAENTTPYGVFLALNALAELNAAPADSAEIAATTLNLQRSDGSFSNSLDEKNGTLNTTAAAVAILAGSGRLNEIDIKGAVDFVRSLEFGGGGFKAVPGAPLPDVLSTASALFALRISGVELDKSECFRHSEFIRNHWREMTPGSAGFAGNMASDIPDAEYTFHALLALGLVR